MNLKIRPEISRMIPANITIPFKENAIKMHPVNPNTGTAFPYRRNSFFCQRAAILVIYSIM